MHFVCRYTIETIYYILEELSNYFFKKLHNYILWYQHAVRRYMKVLYQHAVRTWLSQRCLNSVRRWFSHTLELVKGTACLELSYKFYKLSYNLNKLIPTYFKICKTIQFSFILLFYPSFELSNHFVHTEHIFR